MSGSVPAYSAEHDAVIKKTKAAVQRLNAGADAALDVCETTDHLSCGVAGTCCPNTALLTAAHCEPEPGKPRAACPDTSARGLEQSFRNHCSPRLLES